MSEYLNHTCAICGIKYHACDGCDTQKFTTWRSIVDTIEHYKIFIIIRDYVNGYIDKSKAMEQIKQCDLSDKDNFVPEIKAKIDEILYEEKVTKRSRNKNVNSINISNETIK